MRRLRATLLAILLSLMAVPALAEPTVAARWNQALLDAVKATRASDVVTARALAIVHTAMFDAWACFDDRAIPTHLPASWRRPASERTAANKQAALSHAAFGALLDLFPSRQAQLAETMRQAGQDPAAKITTETTGPAWLRAFAALARARARPDDGGQPEGGLRGGAQSRLSTPRAGQPPRPPGATRR